MITFISFVLILLGAMNWLSIGALQYDFIAGLFGSQASMFSRIIYFFIGVAGIWILVQTFRGKGRIKINDDGFNKKKDVLAEEKPKKAYSAESGKDYSYSNREYHNNSEAGREYIDTNNSYKEEEDYLNQGFPRDMSHYERREDTKFVKDAPPTKTMQDKTHLDYRSLGYKDFNEEDLDR